MPMRIEPKCRNSVSYFRCPGVNCKRFLCKYFVRVWMGVACKCMYPDWRVFVFQKSTWDVLCPSRHGGFFVSITYVCPAYIYTHTRTHTHPTYTGKHMKHTPFCLPIKPLSDAPNKAFWDPPQKDKKPSYFPSFSPPEPISVHLCCVWGGGLGGTICPKLKICQDCWLRTKSFLSVLHAQKAFIQLCSSCFIWSNWLCIILVGTQNKEDFYQQGQCRLY